LLLYDCLSTGAIVFSAHTEDGDGDGLPNLLETTSGLLNPAGLPYPDIRAMGALPDRKDLFVEIGAMWSDAWDAQTSAQHPVPGPHDHMPTAAVLKSVGDALANAPPGRDSIAVHFDVGPTLGAAYRAALGPGPDSYIIAGAGLARGGERMQEVACVEDSDPGTPPCRFPGFKGVVSWPAGYQFLALAPVAPDGSELADPEAAGWCNTNSPADCRRRFDLDREGIFHYMLYAHARGVRKSNFPCLAAPDAMGHQEPVPYPTGTTCGTLQDNAEYYLPKSVSGVAELPGRFAMVTLGLWDNAVGTADMQANTTLHEIGHNLDLWHGGGKPQFTPTASGLRVFVQPNCKPNHLSVMSYLFQATGVRDAAGNARPRFSGELLNPINEGALTTGPLGLSPDAPFTSWYAPKAGSLGETLGLAPSTKHCDGTLLAGDAETVRLEMSSPDAAVDWAATGTGQQYSTGQDVNFDGKTTGGAAVLVGHNDWDGLALNRLASGRSMFGFSLGLGLDFGGLDFGGLDFGGLDFGGLDFGGLDFGGLDFGGLDFGGLVGGLDFGGLDFGGLDFGGLDFGGLDFGGLDFGGLDFGGLDFGGLESEVDAELTREIVEESIAPGGSTGPKALKAFVRGTDGAGGSNSSVPVGNTWVPPGEPTTCDALNPDECHQVRLDWEPPTIGTPDGYAAFRVWDDPSDGLNDMPTAGQVPDPVDTTTGVASTTAFDDAELPNGQRFIYWVRGSTGGTLGSPSNFAIVTAVNAAPVANHDAGAAYSLPEDSPGATFPSVLANDDDEDSPDKSAWAVALVNAPQHGALTLNADGTFTYTPAPDFFGTDTFSYQVNNGTWTQGGSSVPMSANSNTATVTIDVRPVNDAPSFTKGPDQTIHQNAGPQTVPNWATNISAGPNEDAQLVNFIVTNNNNGLFDVQPAISPNGTLTYTPKATAVGVATVTVTIHDDGGTADGGVDTSAPQTFTITVKAIYQAVIAQPKSGKLGSAIPLTWELRLNGTRIVRLSTLIRLTTVYNGPKVPNVACAVNPSGPQMQHYFPTSGATGGSEYRLVSTGYKFNWDTTSVTATGRGCYTIVWQFDDNAGAPPDYPVLNPAMLWMKAVEVQ
jgi:VCBS repeat-containing protein